MSLYSLVDKQRKMKSEKSGQVQVKAFFSASLFGAFDVQSSLGAGSSARSPSLDRLAHSD
jgi:hypothetical protein